jgi:MFS family permease
MTPTPTFMETYGRMAIAGALAVALIVLVAILAPAQLVVTIYKAALVAAAAYGGYWLDRWLFPYARPHALDADVNDGMWSKDDPQGHVFVGSMIRRAIVVVGSMLALALAL